MLIRRARTAAALVVLTAICAVHAQTVPATQAPASARPAVAPRDLAVDEKLGGHTLARHVGKTDSDLAARLKREPGISAASTYTDLATASRVVGEALAQQKSRLDSWLARTGPRPNLALNYQTTGPPIGRSMARGARTAQPCRRAVVVLRWNDSTRRWYVLTSYPEIR